MEREKSNDIVAILTNNDDDIYCFRKELIESIIAAGYRVLISCPYGEKFKLMKNVEYIYDDPEIDRRGTNIIKDSKLFFHYLRLLKKYRPKVILTYTIKPNIYGGIAARILKIPQISTITGLGTAIEDGGILQKFTIRLYKTALKCSKLVFFQNSKNMNFMKTNKVISDNYDMIPGSGVNLHKHCYEEYPKDNGIITFITIGRIMKDKGIDELLSAIKVIKSEYNNVRFRLLGFYEDNYQEIVEKAVHEGLVEYCGHQVDVHKYIKNSHATIHASYHEGMSNVLLESASAGRPVIATNIPGCIETFEPGVSGIPFEPCDSDDLVSAIRTFIDLPYEAKAKLGEQGRKRMEKFFSRDIVIEKYLKAIENI